MKITTALMNACINYHTLQWMHYVLTQCMIKIKSSKFQILPSMQTTQIIYNYNTPLG